MSSLASSSSSPNKKAKLSSPSVSSSSSSSSSQSSIPADDDLPQSPLNPTLFTQEATLRSAYAIASPYRHGVITDVLANGHLDAVLLELKNNLKATFKESDLFKFYQTIDVGNLNVSDNPSLCAKLPTLMSMKSALYSPRFRSFIESVTSLPPGTLVDKIDCAVNCHARGCHLLCHDDVIGTRKISFIVYLTDPLPEWTAKDGGQLELYANDYVQAGAGVASESDVSSSSSSTSSTSTTTTSSSSFPQPRPIPSNFVLPRFNSLAYFQVTPGESFHSVQEVYASDRPRISIQGWYHASTSPPNSDLASLNRLTSKNKSEDTDGNFADAFLGGNVDAKKGSLKFASLSPADVAYLGKYVNATYLTDVSVAAVRRRFQHDSSVQLRDFLLPSVASKIKSLLLLHDEEDKLGGGQAPSSYDLGEKRRGWAVVGPAHKQRYLSFRSSGAAGGGGGDNDDDELGRTLADVQGKLLHSAPFARLLRLVTNLPSVKGHRGAVRRFRPGMDYTVAHYGALTREGVLDCTACFCGGEGKQVTYDEEVGDIVGEGDDETWTSGDVGGFECYIAADEEEEDDGYGGKKPKGAVDEYNEEDDTELLSVSAGFNTLSLVYRDPGTMKFVKYVACGAPSSRVDIAVEYELEDDDDDDDDDEDDESEDDSTKSDEDGDLE